MTWLEHSNAAKGWLFPEERDALHDYATIGQLRSSTAMEIGGYCGKSAIVIGDAVRSSGNDGVLFSLDWHRGSPEMAPNRECHHPEMVDADGLFDSLPHFRRNIRAAGLEDWVVPIIGMSRRVASACFDVPVGLLFIDGAHDFEGVLFDYLAFARNVRSGGFLIFHDATIPAIDAVAKRAETEGFEFETQVESMRVLRAR